MYISRIKLHNFKSFSGDHELNLSSSINFFVGNNNCGKTTIFHAIEFIQSGKSKGDYITKGKENEDISVEVEFEGIDLLEIINADGLNLKKYQDYLTYNSNGTQSLIILRSSEEVEVKQNGKTSVLGIGNIRVYNPNSKEMGIKKFENPTGIDKTITALFDPQFIYSDLRNEDYQDFGKTKMIGKIINSATKDFQNEYDEDGNLTSWGELKEAHNKAFGDQGVQGILSEIESQITNTLTDQYGESEVTFSFKLPGIDNFFKAGSILLSEGGVITDVSEKGTGMQRALAIALIQVYAFITNSKVEAIEKPMMFFIDEPETFLHPEAQNKLMEALETLSRKHQVIVTTHSPYLLKCFDKAKHKVVLFRKKDAHNEAANQEIPGIFEEHSPTWGEVNYYAFDVPSIEFHNELYGFLQAYAIDESDNNYCEEGFEQWLEDRGINKTKDYIRLLKNGNTKEYKTTLPTFIRNLIHHPENTLNKEYTREELNESIRGMIQLIIEVKES